MREVYFGTGATFARGAERSHERAPLAVERLNAWYGAAQVLFDVSFDVGRGEVVALMGRNGAGKSTTMKAVMGLMARAQRHGAASTAAIFRGCGRSRSPASAWASCRRTAASSPT